MSLEMESTTPVVENKQTAKKSRTRKTKGSSSKTTKKASSSKATKKASSTKVTKKASSTKASKTTKTTKTAKTAKKTKSSKSAKVTKSPKLVKKASSSKPKRTRKSKKASTPVVEEASTPVVEEASTPVVEEASTPVVEEASAPVVEEASIVEGAEMVPPTVLEQLSSTSQQESEKASVNDLIKSLSDLNSLINNLYTNVKEVTESNNFTQLYREYKNVRRTFTKFEDELSSQSLRTIVSLEKRVARGKKKKRTGTKNNAVHKKREVSPELVVFMGLEAGSLVSRAEAQRAVHSHIKSSNLKLVDQKMMFRVDERLSGIFPDQERMVYTQIMGGVSRHFL